MFVFVVDSVVVAVFSADSAIVLLTVLTGRPAVLVPTSVVLLFSLFSLVNSLSIIAILFFDLGKM